ncbi:choice-of-anchor A family protein [Bifidobacterium sp. SO1]|uniref:choice-of-anchor A family protein n=1 Tax=Bifidobacterium sp. SO1 TaxID=2809029 RepID=UPI001BDBDB98|nr:choice-of-anchor A family protein [Bifidobacterium sp. SO1]
MALADNGNGCIVKGFQQIEDPAISIYVGRNFTITGNSFESEGSVIVDGNLYDQRITDRHENGSIAGKVMWGMGFYPPANATMLAVGGTAYNSTNFPTYVGGNSRIGGKAKRLRITTVQNLKEDGRGANYTGYYPYPDQKNAKILDQLGKANALKTDSDGDGTLDMDYNDYLTKTLKPLSSSLNAMAATGTTSFEKAPDALNLGHRVEANINDGTRVSIKDEGRIIFTGDGQQHRQIFQLNANDLTTQASKLATNKAWSLDFRNIPDGQAIVVNVTGKNSIDWIPGWRVWVNGFNYSTWVNATGDSLSNYRSIASRILWNFPTVTDLKLSGAPAYEYRDYKPNAQIQKNVNSNGVLFPGTILLPNGSLTDIADTNGRLLIGKDLIFDIWEHHNAPWIGFDEPQCFTVSGKTSATLV